MTKLGRKKPFLVFFIKQHEKFIGPRRGGPFLTDRELIMKGIVYSLVLATIGYAILFWQNPWICLGVFVCVWANNVELKRQGRDLEGDF